MSDNIKGDNTRPFDKIVYKGAIDMPIYLSKCFRPDISYAIHKIARNSKKKKKKNQQFHIVNYSKKI